MTLCIEINKNKKSETPDLVEDDGFVMLHSFMRKKLHLEKTELLVFAIIYGYSKGDKSFTGGIKYLSDWSGSGRSAVKAALASLVEKGLIVKTVKKIRRKRIRKENFLSSTALILRVMLLKGNLTLY